MPAGSVAAPPRKRPSAAGVGACGRNRRPVDEREEAEVVVALGVGLVAVSVPVAASGVSFPSETPKPALMISSEEE